MSRAGLLMAVALAGPAATPGVRFERPIEIEAPGVVAVALDAEVYRRARRDLADLRVEDAAGADVPFVLRDRREPEPAWIEPEVLERSFVRGRESRVVLELDTRVPRRCLEIRSAGDNFRRRVVVEVSDDGDTWRTLSDSGYVFAVPGPTPARYETVALPPSEARFVRVTLLSGDGDPERVAIESVRVPVAAAPVPETLVSVPVSRFEDAAAGETWLTLELPAGAYPVSGVDLEVADERFFRGVVVEARRRSAGGVTWSPLAEGAVYRYPNAGGIRERTRVDVAAREGGLRLRIRNRDDAPLGVSAARVAVPVETVVFEARPGGDYRLSYGDPGRGPAGFDLARTAALGPDAAPARLGPSRRRVVPGAVAETPWTEAHPQVVWIVLLASVAGLAAATWSALRRAA